MRELEGKLAQCVGHFGERAGQKLAEMLCELGLCFRCGGGGRHGGDGVDDAEGQASAASGAVDVGDASTTTTAAALPAAKRR